MIYLNVNKLLDQLQKLGLWEFIRISVFTFIIISCMCAPIWLFLL